MRASGRMPPGRMLTPQWWVPDWPVPPTVRALSTGRVGGASRPPYASLNLGAHVGDAVMAVTKNRRSLREAAGLPAEPCWLSQVHGTRVADLDAPGPWDAADRRQAEAAGAQLAAADAAITREPGRICAILTADCLPVLFASESCDRVGAAHAGWRGLSAGVIETTVKALGCPPRELLVWLGPAIGPRHFEIGPEVREELLRSDAVAADAARGRGVPAGGIGGNFFGGDSAARTVVDAAADGVAGAATNAAADSVADAAADTAADSVADAAADTAADSAANTVADAPADGAFVLNQRGRFMADLYALARRRLAHLGVERIYGGGECTYGGVDKYFSHRRDGTTGRQASLIWLVHGPRR
jgi:polyphenol oxidase